MLGVKPWKLQYICMHDFTSSAIHTHRTAFFFPLPVLIGDGSSQVYNLEQYELLQLSWDPGWCCMLYMNSGNVNLHKDLVPPRAHFHNWYIVMLSCLENPFIPVFCVTGHAVKLQMEYFLQKWALQVKKLCTRGVWRMEAAKWEGLIRNVWIYWLSSNVDTWQAKVIRHFRMRKYYEHMHFLLNSAVSSSTAAKQTRPLLATADSEEVLGRYWRENTAQQTCLVWCQSREQSRARQCSDQTGLLPLLLTLALLSSVSTTKFRADIFLLYDRPTHLGRESKHE